MYLNIEKFKIYNYFFLHKFLPMSIEISFKSDKKTIIRYALYKLLETILNFKSIVKWLWVDFYKYYPLNKEIMDLFKKHNFKICLFSPELKGKSIRTVRKLKFSFIKLKKNLILFVENIFQDEKYFFEIH